MSYTVLSQSSTLNFNFGGVKTHVYGVQGAPFSANGDLIDLRQVAIDTLKFVPRGAYVDNTESANPVTLVISPLNMRLTVAAGVTQALHWPAPAQHTITVIGSGVNTDTTNIWFVDYPVMPFETLSNSGGGSIPDPLPVIVENFPGTQPISGTVSVSNFPATYASTQSGTWTVQATQSGSWSVAVTNFPATQAVTQSTSPWVDNIAQWGGAATSLGQKVSASSVPVVLASDQSSLAFTPNNAGTTSAFGQISTTNTTISFGTSATKTINGFIILAQGLTNSAFTLMFKDGGGTNRIEVVIPGFAGATNQVLYQISGLAIALTNGITAPSIVSSATTTAGAVDITVFYT